jgi:hypothetical protein
MSLFCPQVRIVEGENFEVDLGNFALWVSTLEPLIIVAMKTEPEYLSSEAKRILNARSKNGSHFQFFP